VPLKPVPRREVEHAWRIARVDRVTEQRQRHEQARRVRDLELSVEMQFGRSITFRGRKYGVPPVPWTLVLRILAVADLMADLGKRPSPQLWGQVHKEAERIFKKVARPKSLLPRLFWPFLNPLRGASHLEVATLLDFIFGCLATDCGLTTRPAPSPPSTSPSSTDASPTTLRPGATEKAIRAAGPTSR
jgi:hypothetical protein